MISFNLNLRSQNGTINNPGDVANTLRSVADELDKHTNSTEDSFNENIFDQTAIAGHWSYAQLSDLNDDELFAERFENGDYTEADLQELYTKFSNILKEKYPDGTQLMFADYRDQLNDKEINLYLEADDNFDATILERFEDSRYQAAVEIVEELLSELNIDPDYLKTREVDELRYLVEESDCSTIEDDLIKNTPDQLMRQTLIQFNESEDPSFSKNIYLADTNSGITVEAIAKARTDYVEKKLLEKGVIRRALNENSKNDLMEMFLNGPEYLWDGVILDAIWYGNINEVNLPLSELDPKRTVTTKKCSLVILDYTNGTAFDSQFDEPITLQLTKERPAFLDSEGPGYSVDEICGLYKPAYKTSWTTEQSQ